MWYVDMQWNITQPLKKNEVMPLAATWVGLEMVIPSAVSQTEKEKHHMTSLSTESKKKLYKWTYLQNRNRLTDLKNELLVTEGTGGRKRQGVWD